MLFLLWLCIFILSGVISLLISSSILGTYWPRDFIFQWPIFLTFHTVHGVLKARILKWFTIPFSSGPRFVRTLHYDPSILGGPTWHGSQFHWVRQSCDPCDQFGWFSVTVVFILSFLWWIRIRGLWEPPDGRYLLWGKLSLALMEGWVILSKSLIQLSADRWGLFPPCSLTWEQAMVRVMAVMVTFFKSTYVSMLQLPGLLYSVLNHWQPTVDPHLWWRFLDTYRKVWLSLLWGHCSFLLCPDAHKVLFVPSKRLFLQSCGSSVIKSHWS